MVTVVLREIVIALAFFGMPLWAFGIHWNAFAAGAVLVGVDVYMAHKTPRRARERWVLIDRKGTCGIMSPGYSTAIPAENH